MSQDTEELEALFDTIAAEKQRQTKASASARDAEPAPSADGTCDSLQSSRSIDSETMYQRIGQLTRQLHDALRDVGADQALERVAVEFPDARNRLAYVARLTEQAAERTLNSVEIAQARQSELAIAATRIAGGWNKFFAKEITLAEFRELANDTRRFVAQAESVANATHAQLHEIMMAQDFQDLTGQVIQKLTKLAGEFESQLLRFLVDSLPDERRRELKVSGETDELSGPVVDAGQTDVVTNQEQVDDLLESLGF